MDNEEHRQHGGEGMNVTLRYAARGDAAAINAIYDYYIDNTVVTFNERKKPDEARADEVEETLRGYPYIIAEVDGRLAGFACAEPVRPQSGYRYSVELTIYLAPDAPKHAGIGSLLYGRLLPLLTAQGYRSAYVAIGGENTESVAFHEAQGFEHIARFPKCGYKHGRWLDTIWMRKTLNAFDDAPSPVIPFSEMQK